MIGRLIDHYVIVHEFASVVGTCGQPSHVPLEHVIPSNTHCKRINIEHNYCSCSYTTASQVTKQILPTYIQQSGPISSNDVTQMAKTDGVYSYACTILSDGLFLLELRDAIHSGDGLRILRCWKFMLLYFKAYNHHKYTFEAFRLLSLTNGNIATPLVKEQLIWS